LNCFESNKRKSLTDTTHSIVEKGKNKKTVGTRKKNGDIIVKRLSLWLDGTHDSSYEHALHYGAVFDKHIHTSNLVLLMHLVEEAFRNIHKNSKTWSTLHTSFIVYIEQKKNLRVIFCLFRFNRWNFHKHNIDYPREKFYLFIRSAIFFSPNISNK